MNLKQKLEHHYKAFDKSKLEPDPLQFLHLFEDENDIEPVGLISSVFAYGSVTQINKTLNEIMKLMNNAPYDFIMNFKYERNLKIFHGLKHRFYTETDIVRFFHLMKIAYKEYGSLKNLFLSGFDISDTNVKNGITNFSKYFISTYRKNFGAESSGVKFMFPVPEKGSACKRMNLFLRWMVRKDELDFGLWKEVPPNKLVIPVDTHIAKICIQLKLTSRKNVSWKMAEEITNNLKKFDPADPVKYDFAICHIGMRKMKF